VPHLLLDEVGQAVPDVLATGRDLLDPLQDRDGLGRKALGRLLVRQRHELGGGLLLPAGRDEDVGLLEPQPVVPRPPLELGLDQLQGLRVALPGDEPLDGVLARRSHRILRERPNWPRKANTDPGPRPRADVVVWVERYGKGGSMADNDQGTLGAIKSGVTTAATTAAHTAGTVAGAVGSAVGTAAGAVGSAVGTAAGAVGSAAKKVVGAVRSGAPAPAAAAPKARPRTRRRTTKKATARRGRARKPAARKRGSRKTSSRKASARKTSGRKASGRKAAARKRTTSKVARGRGRAAGRRTSRKK
jgi:hypothetical protein